MRTLEVGVDRGHSTAIVIWVNICGQADKFSVNWVPRSTFHVRRERGWNASPIIDRAANINSVGAVGLPLSRRLIVVK
jgi:hypothetical protein